MSAMSGCIVGFPPQSGGISFGPSLVPLACWESAGLVDVGFGRNAGMTMVETTVGCCCRPTSPLRSCRAATSIATTRTKYMLASKSFKSRYILYDALTTQDSNPQKKSEIVCAVKGLITNACFSAVRGQRGSLNSKDPADGMKMAFVFLTDACYLVTTNRVHRRKSLGGSTSLEDGGSGQQSNRILPPDCDLDIRPSHRDIEDQKPQVPGAASSSLSQLPLSPGLLVCPGDLLSGKQNVFRG